MKRLHGKSISPGYASGPAVILQRYGELIPRRHLSVGQVPFEFERLESALVLSGEELDEIRHRIRREIGKSQSGIFEAHLAILKDPSFSGSVQRRIQTDLVNAEQAVMEEVDAICDQIAKAGTPYLRERQQDIRDVARRVLGHLVGTPISTVSKLPARSVLVAHELLPSDSLHIDRSHLAAIVTEEGGETSHAAILARAIGVPAVTAVDRLLQNVQSGMEILVNGETGEIIISPFAEQASDFAKAQHRWMDESELSLSAEPLPCSTTDGVVLSLLANVSRPEEAWEVKKHFLDGIGLLRTEFLFFDAIEPPSPEFQLDAYQKIADSVEGKPVYVRTLDMADDKRPRFLAAEFDHRVLPYRGLRFSLKEKNLFSTQIAAITRAAVKCDLRILFPMVVDPQDLARAIEIVDQHSEAANLKQRPLLGVMVETPAAVVLFDRLIERADFVSIGTNDLTQYVLAADRGAMDIDDDYSVLHPAVLRMIQNLIDCCLAMKKPLSICGESAGDPKTACLLAGMGVRQLSMSPPRAARVRQFVRCQSMSVLRQLAENALACASTAEVRRLLEGLSTV